MNRNNNRGNDDFEQQMRWALQESLKSQHAPSVSNAAVGMQSVVLRSTVFDSDIRLEVRKGDMTKEVVDCIVNAANKNLGFSFLLFLHYINLNKSIDHASGLAGAIVKNGGEIIQDESDIWRMENVGGKSLSTGAVAVTGAGKLPCKRVIHAVGPIWSISKRLPSSIANLGKELEDKELETAVINSLKQCEELGYSSISLPAISSGIFGFPKDRCAIVMFNTVQEYLKREDCKLKEIRFTNFDDITCNLMVAEFDKRFPQTTSKQ